MIRHRKKGKKLGRKIGPRKALLRSLACSLILHDRIKTTKAKAKFVQPFIERTISIAKVKTLASKRRLHDLLHDKKAEKKVRVELAEKYKDRGSGYTRILKIGKRAGDRAELAQIEFV